MCHSACCQETAAQGSAVVRGHRIPPGRPNSKPHCGGFHVVGVSVRLAVPGCPHDLWIRHRSGGGLYDEFLVSKGNHPAGRGIFRITAVCCSDAGEIDASTNGNVSRCFAALQHACDDFLDVGRFLVIGAFVAALARTTIGIDALRDLFASPWVAIIGMMGLAVALNLCSETDAFIAAGFRGLLPDTAQMAFMVSVLCST